MNHSLLHSRAHLLITDDFPLISAIGISQKPPKSQPIRASVATFMSESGKKEEAREGKEDSRKIDGEYLRGRMEMPCQRNRRVDKEKVVKAKCYTMSLSQGLDVATLALAARQTLSLGLHRASMSTLTSPVRM